jgi:hypothetical protein
VTDLPRGAARAGAEALRAYGDRGGTEEKAARLVLDAALPLIERDVRRKMARHILALDQLDRQQVERTSNKGPFYDMRTSLRRVARGEPLADEQAVIREQLSEVVPVEGSEDG